MQVETRRESNLNPLRTSLCVQGRCPFGDSNPDTPPPKRGEGARVFCAIARIEGTADTGPNPRWGIAFPFFGQSFLDCPRVRALVAQFGADTLVELKKQFE